MINESLLVKPLLDLTVRNGKTRQGKSIWNETDDNLTKAKKSMFHIGKALAPGDVTKGITFAEAIKWEASGKLHIYFRTPPTVLYDRYIILQSAMGTSSISVRGQKLCLKKMYVKE